MNFGLGWLCNLDNFGRIILLAHFKIILGVENLVILETLLVLELFRELFYMEDNHLAMRAELTRRKIAILKSFLLISEFELMRI